MGGFSFGPMMGQFGGQRPMMGGPEQLHPEVAQAIQRMRMGGGPGMGGGMGWDQAQAMRQGPPMGQMAGQLQNWRQGGMLPQAAPRMGGVAGALMGRGGWAGPQGGGFTPALNWQRQQFNNQMGGPQNAAPQGWMRQAYAANHLR